jgi:hypothetical protein
VYPAKDAQALAERIDYWFDHPEKRWAMGFRYMESMKKYDIRSCAQELINMFQKAIDAKKHETHPLHHPQPAADNRPSIGFDKHIA